MEVHGVLLIMEEVEEVEEVYLVEMVVMVDLCKVDY